MMTWSADRLAELPVEDGFRLRGQQMTRLETFVDAAFAFALTLLVISVDAIPSSYTEMVAALKGVPAFAASFAAIASMWIAHLDWSRRYGLEDLGSTIFTLTLIFIILVYVYPLKMVFSGFFAFITGGWLPATFTVESQQELAGLFVIYGIGFAAVMGMLMLLYWRALKAAVPLGLDAYEIHRTKADIGLLGVVAATAVGSTLFALLMPPKIGVFAGFVYFLLPLLMPIVAIRYAREGERILETLRRPPSP